MSMEKLQFMNFELDSGYCTMLSDILRQMSVKQIIEYMAELTENTVVLYTINGSHIFSARETADTRGILSNLLKILSIPEKFESFMAQNQTNRAVTEYENVYLDYYGAQSVTALSSDLFNKDALIGRVFSFVIDENKLDRSKKVLKAFSDILAERIQVSYSSASITDIRGGNLDINSGTKWLRKLSGDEFQNFYILAIETGGKNTDDYTGLKDMLDQNRFMFRQVISEGYLSILFNLRSSEELSFLRDLLEGYCIAHKQYAGFSFRFRSSENIRNGFLQATEAVKAAKFLGFKPSFCDFELLCVDALLYEMMRTSGLECYRNMALEELSCFDKENDTNYFETLKVFIANGGSMQNTSKALFIHRNTLAYRLEKIEELMNISLHDVNIQAQIWFELKIKDVLDRETQI